MFLSILVAGAWVVTTHAAAVQQQKDPKSFCNGVNKFVTALQQQRSASSFCSSYLHIPTRTTTVTTTTTQSSSTTVFPTLTTTISPTVTAVSTSLATSNTQTTVFGSPSTVISQSTTFVATSTVFTSTVTSLTTAFTTTTSTSTVTSVSTQDLSFCTAPALRKRSVQKGTLRQKRGAPKPGCFAGYEIPSAISSACSCLSIPTPTSTRTVTATTARVSTITSPRTATQTSPVTQTSVSTSTTTIVSTVFATQTTTVFQVVSSTATIQTDTTTVSTTTSTSTAVATQTSTVPRYNNFALQASFNNQFGSIHDSVGGSGQGVYFDKTDKSTAATFAFQGTKLYYNDQYVQSYAAASDDYYVVVDRPFAQFGYATDCTLNMPSFSGDGCVLDCQVDQNGFNTVTGNDVDNYGGAWGFKGDSDRFTVYAVGQT